jgi:hypothetical protein
MTVAVAVAVAVDDDDEDSERAWEISDLRLYILVDFAAWMKKV